MKFGIFYELQLPRPWVEGDELKLYQNALTQLETADRCGYDYAGVVEHHFLEEYSHSPVPESFLAAASQRPTTHGAGNGSFHSTPTHPPGPPARDQEHPARPRHHPTHHQPSRACRRTRRRARSFEQRSLRVRHG